LRANGKSVSTAAPTSAAADQPLRRRAIGERIIDLKKVRFLAPHHRFDGIEVTAEGSGDADIPAETSRFLFAQYRQIPTRIADIVQLHQIDPVGAQPLQGGMQPSGGGVAVVVFELGR
jgi:hypothetical protein